jgi:hypothetical protein
MPANAAYAKQFAPRLLTTAGSGLIILILFLLVARSCPAAAIYQVTFTASWSAETHPENFPGNPHFSGLIGGTHNAAVSFWEEGELASLGIKRMAEWGSQTPLDEEVEAAIAAGNAETVLRGGIINPSPGTTSFTFTLSEEFSRVTLVTMVAPSPDWFVGVSGLDLRSAGTWAEELVVELWPYDAGTDSGPNYNSPNQPTNPPDPITLITSLPLGNGVALGTFTFSLVGEPSAVPELTPLTLSNHPNPFNPSTRIHFALPRAGHVRLEVYDLTGHRVDTLLDGEREAGPQSIAYTPRDLASGSYLYRLHTADETVTRKMMLLK